MRPDGSSVGSAMRHGSRRTLVILAVWVVLLVGVLYLMTAGGPGFTPRR